MPLLVTVAWAVLPLASSTVWPLLITRLGAMGSGTDMVSLSRKSLMVIKLKFPIIGWTLTLGSFLART